MNGRYPQHLSHQHNHLKSAAIYAAHGHNLHHNLQDERPFPFHNLYPHADGRSSPTFCDFPKPQPAGSVSCPQLLLIETAVSFANLLPLSKTSPNLHHENRPPLWKRATTKSLQK
jgi:hypothetical protein